MSGFGYIENGVWVPSDPFSSAFHGLKNLLIGKSEAEIKLEQQREKEAIMGGIIMLGPANALPSKTSPYSWIIGEGGHYHILFNEKFIPKDVNAPIDIEFDDYDEMITIYNDIVDNKDWNTSISPISIKFKDGTVIDEKTNQRYKPSGPSYNRFNPVHVIVTDDTPVDRTQPPKPKGPSYNRFHPAHVIVTDDIPVDRTKKPNEPLEENTSSIYAIIPIAIIFFAMT